MEKWLSEGVHIMGLLVIVVWKWQAENKLIEVMWIANYRLPHYTVWLLLWNDNYQLPPFLRNFDEKLLLFVLFTIILQLYKTFNVNAYAWLLALNWAGTCLSLKRFVETVWDFTTTNYLFIAHDIMPFDVCRKPISQDRNLSDSWAKWALCFTSANRQLAVNAKNKLLARPKHFYIYYSYTFATTTYFSPCTQHWILP